ncbi:MAG TPA: enoyl-ACP reductase [Pyrinomonadaceae bacterium]|nr:enoyl-ACP reductase [Pyrinomonadaceae bacterium]
MIWGVANKRSIAWAAAQALAREGARLAFTYQNERLKDNVEELTKQLNDPLVVRVQCDVMRPEEVRQAIEHVKEEFDGRLDFIIHSLAYAPREALEGEYVETSIEAFRTALEVSAYSLTAIAREAKPYMVSEGGSIVTMTYYGAEKVMPGYNVMGVAKAALEASTRYLASDLGKHNIRVNAISAGPINTLAARGVGNLSGMLKHHAEHAPLKRNVEAREVGDVALFLCSDLSSAVTGEVLHVDCGYNIMGI